MENAEQRMRTAWQDKPPVKKRKKRIILIAFAAILVGFLLCVALFNLLGLFHIKAIVLSDKSQTVYSEEEILAASNLQVGDEILACSKKELSQRIQEKLPAVNDVKVRKTLTGKVVLTIQDVDLWFTCSDEERSYVMDADMRVICIRDAHFDNVSLIRMNVSSDVIPTIGEILDFGENQSYYIEFLGNLLVSEEGNRVTAVDLCKRYDLYALYDDMFLFRFGGLTNLAVKLRLVNAALEDPLYNGSTCVVTDVRDTGKMVARPCTKEEIEKVFD